MAKHAVNLDALIRREDFDISDDQQQPPLLTGTVKVGELERDNITYQALRKPDFQRETANWTSEKVTEFVRSFLDGDLIPSIILWRAANTGNIFVIDGAHRLSALIAWAHDDYGDGPASRAFFDNSIPPEQKKAADETRALIRKMVGSYADLKAAGRDPKSAPPETVKRSKNLSSFAVQLQWVTGDANKAEQSFFKIGSPAVSVGLMTVPAETGRGLRVRA